MKLVLAIIGGIALIGGLGYGSYLGYNEVWNQGYEQAQHDDAIVQKKSSEDFDAKTKEAEREIIALHKIAILGKPLKSCTGYTNGCGDIDYTGGNVTVRVGTKTVSFQPTFNQAGEIVDLTLLPATSQMSM